MDTLILVVTILCAICGLYALVRIGVMWCALGFAQQHEAIDALDLGAWLDGLRQKCLLLNISALLAVGLGVSGSTGGEIALASESMRIVMMLVAAGVLIACDFGYQQVCRNYDRTVGLTVGEASHDVVGLCS